MDREMELIKELSQETDSKIVLLVLDGIGDLPSLKLGGKTPLEAAKKPRMDKLAKKSILGLLDPVFPGVTPGSGPGHLGLFGYDPIEYQVGRGVLSALGVGFELTKKDVAARLNFCTVDSKGVVIDRRAGRIPTELCKKLCEKIQKKVKTIDGIKIFIMPEKEHRAVLVLRGAGLGGNVTDTDPQKTGVKPLEPKGLDRASQKTAKIVKKFLEKARQILKTEKPANMLLARGFAKYEPFPSYQEVFKLKAAAIATYPMYKGLAKLVGMNVLELDGEDLTAEARALVENWNSYNFFFVHVKKTDSYGEDGNPVAKKKVIEETDRVLLPVIEKLNPDVLVITGDHSTPCILKAHSWHGVPVMVYSKYVRPNGVKFTERTCSKGGLGRMRAKYLLPYILACALKLKKFGA